MTCIVGNVVYGQCTLLGSIDLFQDNHTPFLLWATFAADLEFDTCALECGGCAQDCSEYVLFWQMAEG